MAMTMSEQIMHSTIRIEIMDHNNHLLSTGTGFFFKFLLENGYSIQTIVTNKHVVRGAIRGSLVFSTTKDGEMPDYGDKHVCIVDNFEKSFIMHPEQDVDLCVLPILPIVKQVNESIVNNVFFVTLDKTHIPTVDQVKELSALENIVMIGYPNGLWDEQNNLPIFRTGVTAIHPKFDYNGKPDIVADIASYPGSSGSPICILNEGSYGNASGLFLSNRFYFMGILYAGPLRTVTGEIMQVTIPTSTLYVVQSNHMLNIGYGVKSLKLLDFEDVLKSKFR